MTDREKTELELADICRKHTRRVQTSTVGSLLALIITLVGYFFATVGVADGAPDIGVIIGVAVGFQLVMALNGIANNLALANAYKALKLRRAPAAHPDE